jgi:hypothetical protein
MRTSNARLATGGEFVSLGDGALESAGVAESLSVASGVAVSVAAAGSDDEGDGSGAGSGEGASVAEGSGLGASVGVLLGLVVSVVVVASLDAGNAAVPDIIDAITASGTRIASALFV